MLSNETVQKAIVLITRRANYDYFFSKLDNPEWISPLREKGLFSTPPAIESDGKYIRHHRWPESQYLTKMAERAPDVVTDTILKVPDTNNERVHEDFLEAALKMPVEYARKIGKKELQWIRSQKQFYFLYPEYAGRLIILLAQGDELGIAFHLLEALLALDKVEREYGVPGEDGYRKSVDVVAKFSIWEYKRVVEKTITILAGIDGMRTIQVLCNLLENAIDMSLIEPNPPSDYSYIWLTTVEDHEQNRHSDSDLKAILGIAIRDTILQIIADDSSLLMELVASLEERKWLVFKRIAIFLLSLYAKEYPDEISRKLTDKPLFDDGAYRHEYALLAQAGFGLIGEDERQTILSWVDAEPSNEELTKYKIWYLGKHGKEASDEEVTAVKEQRRLNRLWQFRKDLPTGWKEKYESWVKRYGEPDHPDFSFYMSSGWVGPTSPKSSDELQEKKTSEIVEFLKCWEPPGGHFVDTPEGLSRTLAIVVSNNPARFAKDAPQFIGLDPTYVRGFIDGFREMAKSKEDMSWESLLELFRWVVGQAQDYSEKETALMDKDQDWSWCRKSIAGFLSSSLNNSSREIPFEFRKYIWDILAVLAEDPDPAEEEYGEGHMDPSEYAMNTIRGEAMQAVVNYGLWVVRHSEGAEKNFDLMPELREVLNKHLSSDTSLAIRSVYGQNFPWLYLLDNLWAESNKGRIFSSENTAYWDAVWKTYITFCQPFDLMLEVLKDQYAMAIEKLGEQSEIAIQIANAEERLVEHLMVFYWRGKLNLADDLMTIFYSRASVGLKAHALEFLGHNLRNTSQELDHDVVDRLLDFWEWRLEQAKEADKQELAGYCWWFASGKMDTDWALNQLQTVLALPIKFDALDFIAEELVKLVQEKPEEVLASLNLMIVQLKTEGTYFSWEAEAKQILGAAIQSGDGSIKKKAEDIIHLLGAMGYFEFRELYR